MLATALVTSAIAPSRAAAQYGVDYDVNFAWPYVFRGQVRTTLPTLQPRVWLTTGIPGVAVSLGAWSLIEPMAPRARDFSLRGGDGSPFAQWDAWADVTTRLLGQDLTAGVTRYQFVNSLPPGGLRTTPYAELYVGAERAFDTPLADAWWYRARFWQSLGGTDTRFVEAALGPQFYLIPLRDVSLSLTGGLGLNLGSATSASRRQATYTERGVVYYDLAATLVSVPQCYENREVKITERVLDFLVPRQITGRLQFGRDSTTRFQRRGAERAAFGILEALWSPRHCARTR